MEIVDMSDWKQRLQREQLTIEEIVIQLEVALNHFDQGKVDKAKWTIRYLTSELKERK